MKKKNNELEMIQQFMDDNRKWSDKKFGNQSAISVLKHLRKETTETIQAIKKERIAVSSLRKRKEETKFEFADCYLLLLNSASRHGLSFKELHETAIAKMEINRKRKWGKLNKQGFVEHLEPKKIKSSKVNNKRYR